MALVPGGKGPIAIVMKQLLAGWWDCDCNGRLARCGYDGDVKIMVAVTMVGNSIASSQLPLQLHRK